MRTTINIDEDILEKVRSLAAGMDQKLGVTINQLLLAGLQQRGTLSVKRKGKVPVIITPPGSQSPNFEKLVREWKEDG